MKNLVHFDKSFCYPEYSGVVRCTNENDAQDACNWIHVECEDGKVIWLNWYELQASRDKIALRWIPPTVCIADMRWTTFSDALCAALLPRELNRLIIEYTDLTGTVDVPSLPRKLVEISLMECKLRGTIVFQSLPPQIQVINLRRNAFKCAVFRNSDLPESLKIIQMSSISERMRVRSLDGPLDDRIIYNNFA